MLDKALYNGTVTLRFNPKFHLYTVDGVKIDGTTSATKIVDKSGPLMFWAVRVCADFMRANLKPGVPLDEVQIKEMLETASKQHMISKTRAGGIGTMIHEWIEKWIKGGNPALPVNLAMFNAVSAFKDWVQKEKAEFLLSERQVYSREHHYAGTLDYVCVLGGNKLMLGDIKTSSGIYDDMRYQVSAYLEALKEEIEYLMSIPFETIKDPKDQKMVAEYKRCGGFSGRIIVRIGKETKENGMFDLEARLLDEHEKDFESFLACLVLFRRQKQLKGMTAPIGLKVGKL